MILNIWMMHRSSKSTIHYIRWWGIPLAFINNNWKYWMNSNEMIDIDLPSLQSIQLGECALAGRWDDESSSLTLRSIMNWLVMICFVDLPNLTSISSVEWSFSNPRVVTLASISEYWILIVFRYSKSSKCRATWFIRESSIEINFEYCVDWFDLIHRCFFHSRWSCHRHSEIQTLDI